MGAKIVPQKKILQTSGIKKIHASKIFIPPPTPLIPVISNGPSFFVVVLHDFNAVLYD